MCGILGIYSRSGSLPDRARFSQALDRLQRRGPDDVGEWQAPQALLGHRRLAVVDLTPSGRQPMVSADGRYVIVFNGEIYNHLTLRGQLDPPGGWRGTCDTETLLEAYRVWGAGCLARLSGMFAFAIWDTHERRLFAARDRLGVKPLYYSAGTAHFAFASRPVALTTLLADCGEIDLEALRVYLELGYIPSPLSLYRNVRKLPPAHYLLCDARGLRIVRYWDYRHIRPDPTLAQRDEEDLADELEELVCRSVRERLISDVPLGAFLSGGVDGSIVVAAMKAAGVTNPRAFTISFAERKHDEGPAAARIAAHLGVDHITEALSVGSLLDLMPQFVDEFDEPFADNSAFATLAVARLARRHVTVALTGDGGDELFGGYHYYGLAQRLAPMLRWPERAKQSTRAMLDALPSHKAKLLSGALSSRTPVGLFHYLRSFGKDFGSLLTPDAMPSTSSAESWLAHHAASFATDLAPAEIAMRLDLRFMLSDGYLQKVDVATMAHSLEARCPLTDYRLAEWSMRLPLRYKIRGSHTKYLLKKVLARHVPAHLVYRGKKGFGVPVAEWLRGPLKHWALELLHDDSLASRVPLDRARVLALFELHQSRKRHVHPLLWSVLMLYCFMAKHDRRLGFPEIVQRRAA